MQHFADVGTRDRGPRLELEQEPEAVGNLLQPIHRSDRHRQKRHHEPEGIVGVITGRAIYQGTVDFKQAQAEADRISEAGKGKAEG